MDDCELAGKVHYFEPTLSYWWIVNQFRRIRLPRFHGDIIDKYYTKKKRFASIGVRYSDNSTFWETSSRSVTASCLATELLPNKELRTQPDSAQRHDPKLTPAMQFLLRTRPHKSATNVSGSRSSIISSISRSTSADWEQQMQQGHMR